MPALACQNAPVADAIDRKSLPVDLDRCHEIIIEKHTAIREKEDIILEKETLIQSLSADLKLSKEQIDYLTRKLFGRRSEKIVTGEGQLMLFGELEGDAAQAEELDGADDAVESEEEAAPRPRKRRGRKPLPKDLARVRVEHDLSPEERGCPECGRERKRIGEEITEQIEYVPASVHVIEHAQIKYACPHCQGHVAQGEKPAQPIEKSLAAAGMLAHVITSKYCDHLPLYRQEDILARHGVEISRATLCDWVMRSAAVVEPVVNRMKKKILSGDIVNTDDTPVPTQDPKNKGSTHRSYLWVYVGDENNPFTVYDFTWSRAGKNPRDFLGRFEGYVQADAFGGYDALFDKKPDDPTNDCVVVEAGCWAHARRKFYEARGSAPEPAHQALNRIRKLYAIEKQAKQQSLGPEQRRALRREQARPILEKLFEWMERIQPLVLPKSPLGAALGYALGNRAALSRYIDVGELAIDNNVAENALRRVCLGRKNWLFAGSARGGRAAAILYSLIETARRHGHDPFAYLRDVLTRIPTHKQKDLDELLPDAWKPQPPRD